MIKILPSPTPLLKIKRSLLVGLLVFWCGVSWGQVTKNFNVTNGSWSDPGNWTPSGVPAAGDNVIFPSTVTSVTNMPATTVNGVEIQGTSGTLSFSNSNSGSNGENFLDITSSFSIQSGRTLFLEQGNGQRRISLIFGTGCTATVLGTINITGRTNPIEQGVVNDGTIILGPTGLIRNPANSAYFSSTAGSTIRIGSPDGISSSGPTGNIQTSTRTFSNAANYSYIGAANQTVGTGLPATVENLTIANTGPAGNNIVTPVGNTVITSNLTVTSGSLNLGTFTANRITSGGTFTLAANASLLVGGAATTNFPSNYTTNIIDCTSTVDYNFAGDQTVRGFNYGNLTFSGSGIKTLQTATTNICSNLTLSGTTSTTAVIGLSIGGNVTIGTGTTFTAGAFTHTVGGNWSRTGTFTPGTSTIEFNGSNPGAIQSTTFHNLTFSGSGSKTASGNLIITENVLISNNFNAGSFNHTVAGNWSRTGTFTPGTSTIEFNGSNPATIQSTTFNNLTFSGTGTKTATGNLTINGNVLISNNFSAGSFNHVVNGNWNNSGTFTPGTSTVVFSGSTAQTISGAGTNTFTNLILNNSTGLTMSSAASVTGALTLSSGTLATGTNLTMNTGSEIIRSSGAMSGTIQGSNSYNLTYQGTSKTTGSEVSGSGLNNMFLTLSSSQVLTAAGALTVKGTLNIPNTITLNMVGFQLSGNTLTTSGSGTLSTQSTSASPLPLNRSWSFLVLYNNLTGGQKVVNGVYQNLTTQLNSGTTTLGPDSDGPIEIASGNITRTGTGGTLSAGTSTVIFSGISAQNITAITYNNLELKGSGDKVFTGSQNITGNLTITGSAVARLGSSNRSANTLTLGGAGQPIGSFGSTASSASFKNATYFGSADTGILNVTTSSLICTSGTWIGATSTDWFTAANWCGGIPTATTDVLIVSTAPFQPIINVNSASARNITIQTGASLTISGAFTLSLHGNWANSGTFTPGTTSTVNFTGTPSATIGASSFANISFTGSGTKTINGILSVSGNITPVSTPVILSGSNTLTLNSEKTMEILSSGSFATVSGKLILKPGAIYVNLSTSNPSLEIQQTITGNKGWRMIGTPFATAYSNLTAGFETQGFSGSTNPTLQPNLLWWDETNNGTSLQAWRQPSNLAANAPAGRGHYFYVFNGESKPAPATGNYSDVLPITMNVTGSEVNLASGIFTFPVTFTARDSNLVAQADTLVEVNQADEGFNLIANPTASTIDFHSASGWTKTNIDETIYVWDPATNSFLTWNGLTGSLGSGRIAPFQAFWVKANAASPALQISNNNVKSLVSTEFYGRKLEESPFKIDLQVTGEGLEAKSFISFDQDGKEGADLKDAYQLESLAQDWLLLYTYGSIKTKSPLVINNLPDLGPEEKVIPLHLAASKKGQAISGSYLMDWKLPAEWPADVEIVLMDHIQKKAIDMRKESMHSFTYQAPEIPSEGARKSQGEFTAPKAVIFQSPFESGEVNARITNSAKLQRPFTIYIGSFPQDRIEYLPDFPKLFAPVPNPFREQTKISFYLPVAEKAEVLIYDMLGKSVGNFPAAVYQEGIQELVWTPSGVEIPSGMYIIRLVTKTHSFTQKLIKN